jgi:hypothetical protein
MKHIARLFFVMAFMSLVFTARAQLVVNGKNLNDDKELTYIQLMYTIDRGSLKPVFFVDYGFIEPDYNDIIKPSKDGSGQKISINGEDISDRVTVVWVLNKLHKAGWEYIGDVIYVPVPMMDNWHVFTLRRRAN